MLYLFNKRCNHFVISSYNENELRSLELGFLHGLGGATSK